MAHKLLARMPCLYTKQKTKKRKTWHDGRLDVFSSGSCFLFDAPTENKIKSSAPLDSLVVGGDELQQVLNGGETELELESYLVEIEEITPVEVEYADAQRPLDITPAAAAVPVQQKTKREDLNQPQASFQQHSRGNRPMAVAPDLETSVPPRDVDKPLVVAGKAVKVVKAAPIISKANLVRPFKAPTPFIPPFVNYDRVPSIPIANIISVESIQARYPEHKPPQHAPQTRVGGPFDSRYEGIPGSAGNGRYAVSNDDIDDMWAAEEDSDASQGQNGQHPNQSEEARELADVKEYTEVIEATHYGNKAFSGDNRNNAHYGSVHVNETENRGGDVIANNNPISAAVPTSAASWEDAGDIWDTSAPPAKHPDVACDRTNEVHVHVDNDDIWGAD